MIAQSDGDSGDRNRLTQKRTRQSRRNRKLNEIVTLETVLFAIISYGCSGLVQVGLFGTGNSSAAREDDF